MPQRILIVTRNLPPLVGGMERLNWHLAAELARRADVRVIAPQGSAALGPEGVLVREAPLAPLWKFLLAARHLARREARRWRPHVVLAGSGLTAPVVRSAARICGARTAVYVHGLDIAIDHPAYRALWLPAIRRMERVIANSHATAELCRGIGVDGGRIGIVHPGVDLPADDPVTQAGMPVGVPASSKRKAVHGPARGNGTQAAAKGCPGNEMGVPCSGKGVPGHGRFLLSVGRLSARKGLREFVRCALPRIVAAQPDACLLVVGDIPNQALRARAQSRDSIAQAADDAGIGGHVCFTGVITDAAELGAIYAACDLHVFPVRAIPGDPEGFGMVAVEAAAHGLPTVAFATGGVVDAVAEGRSGHLVAPGDYAGFADTVIATLLEREKLRPTSIAHAREFIWPRFGERVARQLGIADSRCPTMDE